MDFWKAAARPSGTRTLNPVNSLRIDRAPVPPSPKASMTGKNCERGARSTRSRSAPRAHRTPRVAAAFQRRVSALWMGTYTSPAYAP
jgi:hypothetical protein